ncbi:MAG TPA: hypothetical protein VJO34_09215 [Methylomirabilota bacterium]|nr:hypothetical protein [Methylomirabilota bacterium]
MDEQKKIETLECPFLHSVMADSLWMCPTALYCHPPSQGIRVPSTDTLAEVCLNGQYPKRCAVYRGYEAEKLLRALTW